MSEGQLCTCPLRPHPTPPWLKDGKADPLGLEPGACRNYAELPSGLCYDCLGRGHQWGKDKP